MTSEEKVLNIMPTANMCIDLRSISIWSGRGKGELASIKRDEYLRNFTLNDDIEKAWKMAWIYIEKQLIETLES